MAGSVCPSRSPQKWKLASTTPYPIGAAVVDARQMSTGCVEIPTFVQQIAAHDAKAFCLQPVAVVPTRTHFGMSRAVGMPRIMVLEFQAESSAFKEGVGLMSTFTPPANNSVIMTSLKEMSDAGLVSIAKSGDAIAFVELSRRHSDKILRRTYRIVKNWQDAEDVLQDSFMKAFIHLKDFEERASFSSWLTRIAINTALMLLRKKRFHLEISTGSADDDFGIRDCWEPRDLAESPENRCARREQEELLKGAIQGLPPILRDVVQM